MTATVVAVGIMHEDKMALVAHGGAKMARNNYAKHYFSVTKKYLNCLCALALFVTMFSNYAMRIMRRVVTKTVLGYLSVSNSFCNLKRT